MGQKNYRELLTFVDSSVRADVNGALEWPNRPHGNDFFSEDPAMLLQTAEQSAAEQQSAVAGSDSMRQLDEFMEECIDPAVLGPNAATPYVGAKMYSCHAPTLLVPSSPAPSERVLTTKTSHPPFEPFFNTQSIQPLRR
ncbi:hypothetical protein E5D57_013180 [Metarhizium anisopliae]|nr:hypothetical protein E5D57_013180 [Metarhizium anisopliae]